MFRLLMFAPCLLVATAVAEPDVPDRAKSKPSYLKSSTIAAASTGESLGALLEAWWIERYSVISQIEYVDTSGDGFLAFRLGAGAGAAIERPGLRAGVHAGVALEIAPMGTGPDEDHAGVSGFLEARGEASPGPMYLLGTTRATYYRDLDCREHTQRTKFGDTQQPGCGTSSDDFAPRWGWEAEVRIGTTKAGGGTLHGISQGGFIGARYLTVVAADRVEHHVLAMVGWATW